MESMCRMCGPKASPGDLVTKLNTDVNNVSLRFLFEMFTHCKFDDNPLLPQGVCESCRVTLFKFIEFSRLIEEMQLTLKRSVAQKGEDAGCGVLTQNQKKKKNCDSSFTEYREPAEESDNESLCNYAASAPPSPSSPFMRKMAAEYNLTECSVVLECLPLVYVKTDTEDSDSDSEDKPSNVSKKVESKSKKNVPRAKKRGASSKKRGLGKSQANSPNKRMRLGPMSPGSKKAETKPHRPFNFSPQLPKAEAAEKRALVVTTQQQKPATVVSTPVMKQYEELFKKELTEDIRKSAYNLAITDAAKEVDGTVKADYLQLFKTWSVIKVKCLFKTCKKELEPYEMKRHLRDYHKVNDGVFRCSLSGCSEEYSYLKFCQHVVEKHLPFLSYSCVYCPTMYYNYAALCRHYQNEHSEVKDFHICLRDGFFFETMEKLEEHVASHQIPRGRKRISCNNNSLNESQEKASKANSGNACDICSKSFNTKFDLEWHKMAHADEQNFAR